MAYRQRRRSRVRTAAQKEAIKKWQAAGAAKRKDMTPSVRKLAAVKHGHQKLISQISSLMGKKRQRYANAAFKLMIKARNYQ